MPLYTYKVAYGTDIQQRYMPENKSPLTGAIVIHNCRFGYWDAFTLRQMITSCKSYVLEMGNILSIPVAYVPGARPLV